MIVKIANQSSNPLPKYQTTGSAGMDIHANISQEIELNPLERKLIPTGLFVEIPMGNEIQVRPRSGLALKNGITVLNSPGTIDSDYRGEVGVILINLGEESFTINNGDRIAQAVMAQALGGNYYKLTEVDEIDDNTERSTGGFGSTGVK